MSSSAYHIKDGRIETHEIPDEGLAIPVGLSEECLVFPGVEDQHWRSFTLAAVADIASVLTPGRDWWCAPNLQKQKIAYGDGPVLSAVVGVAHMLPEKIFLDIECGPIRVVSTAYHEAFHVLERDLRLDEMEIMRSATNKGAYWPNEYLHSDIERRARLFQNAAMFVREGGTLLEGKHSPETAIFAKILSGEIGRRRFRKAPLPSFARLLGLAA